MANTRAGWTVTEITPPLGLPMGGRGPRFTPGAEVLDPLQAHALLLQDGDGERLLIVSLDLIGMTWTAATEIRTAMAGLAGVSLDRVVLNFAHIHNGPMTNWDKYATTVRKSEAMAAYETELREKLLRLVPACMERMVAVTPMLHRGTSHIGINRRNRDAEGNMGLRPNAAGHYNPDVWVLDLPSPENGERAVVYSYGCHPVLVYGYAWDGISADWVGASRRALKERLGTGVHTQFVQGLAGNVRPRAVANCEQNRFEKATPEVVQQVGAELADDVAAALDKRGKGLDLALRSGMGSVALPRDPERVEAPEYWQHLAASDDELSRNLGRYWSERLQSGLPPYQAVPLDIGLVELASGERIAWMGGEGVAEWQPALRRWLDDAQLTVWGYCQDVPCYVPTDELIPEGGYEVINSNRNSIYGPGPFRPGMDAVMRRGFSALGRHLSR